MLSEGIYGCNSEQESFERALEHDNTTSRHIILSDSHSLLSR